MSILTVRNLTKSYPAFLLDHVSFSLEAGKITGFIGRNGAGKSTTLNSLFHFTHPDSGDISFFGMDVSAYETEIKQRVGFVSSGVNYYPKKRLKTISEVTRSFYRGWDDAAYRDYMRMFHLDEQKTPSELSSGMKVKYALTLALSHNADLLILDEPTSGLDPVSRNDLLDVFMELCEKGKTILFSTHITSDLDKCADRIIYIRNGKIIADADMKAFESDYLIAAFDSLEETEAHGDLILGRRKTRNGYTALIRAADSGAVGAAVQKANLESIMVHLEKEAD